MIENVPCIRCQSTHVVPGYGFDRFVVDSSVALERPSWFKAVHDVQLEEIAWLCLDCGVWTQTVPEGLEQLRSGLRDKCDSEYRKQLFDT